MLVASGNPAPSRPALKKEQPVKNYFFENRRQESNSVIIDEVNPFKLTTKFGLKNIFQKIINFTNKGNTFTMKES